MRRDQKLAKKRKEREQARVAARRARAGSSAGFSLSKAATKPFGPCWLSCSWRDDEMPPELVSVVITRDLGSEYVAHIMLVDRTCLGVKSALTAGPLTRSMLLEAVARVGQAHVDGMEEASLEDAQSVVFAAVAYAERLGLRPDRDFDARLVGPAPSPLKPTPLAALKRPFYVPGPHDDFARIIGALRRAVGEEGFDVGGFDEDESEYDDEEDDYGDDDNDDDDYGDDDNDDDDNDNVNEKRADEIEISDAIGAAFVALAPDGKLPEGNVAMEQFLTALGLDDNGVLPPEHVTSLPSFWALLFRPLANRTRGVDVMLRKRRPKKGAAFAAFAALAETRAVLFEVLSVLGANGTCRDLITGEILRVRLGAMATKATRWMRFFAYLTPMEDGTLYPASTMLGHVWLRNVSIEAWIAKLNDLLQALDVDDRINPSNPTEGLTRWGALAHAVLHGMIAPSAEEHEERSRPLYVVDSDGERFEFHEATIPLASDVVERTLVAALDHADDFVAGDDGFTWMREPKARGVVTGEHVAFIESPKLGAIRVTTTSVARFESLCARLEALAGARLVPSQVDVVRPWERMPNAVAVETPESRRLIFGSSRVASGESLDMDRLVVDGVRRALDEDVPMLGGKPRDLVRRDDDGRHRVERWIQDQELRGMPVGHAFLDLDAVRRELGLPPVFPLSGAAAGVAVPDRKISETILEFAQPILEPLGALPELAEARRALELAVGVWNFHAMATPHWGKPEYLAEARKSMRAPGVPPELSTIFESLLARRASLYGDDLRVVGEWTLGSDGRGGHAFRCDARLPMCPTT